jgi:hypothetical protein
MTLEAEAPAGSPRGRIAGRRRHGRTRQKAGLGLTRPELAVLLAYGKLDLNDDIVASDAPDDAFSRHAARLLPGALAPYHADGTATGCAAKSSPPSSPTTW